MNKYLLLVISVSASQAAGLKAQTWSTLDAGISYPIGYVAALAQHQGQLYAGGFFYSASGVPANNVARWNGSNWSALGNGLGAGSFESVQCLASFNGDLYAGGYFALNPNTDSSSSIAKWNGSQWVRVGSIPIYSVKQLTVYNGELYASAYFPTLDSVVGACLAKWNGSQWSKVGNGPDWFINYVYCMVVHNGDLYIGGDMVGGGGGTIHSAVAKWNGTSWSTISSDFGGPVYSLASYNGELYAGGHFFSIDTLSASQIARWNGTRWSTVGTGINYYADESWASSVNTLSVYRGALYAGGYFYHAGVVNTANIAKWDGSSWSGLGQGANYWVSALSATDSVLYVGGWFRYVDGNIEARKIAKWKENCPSAPILSPSDSIRGSQWVCSGSTQHYYLPPIAGALSYNWTLPGGWSGQSISNSIQVTTGNSSGIITVSAIGSCSSNSTSLPITIIPVPPAPGPILGNAAICQLSNNTYNTSAPPWATAYSWSLPAGWQGQSNSTSISLVAGINSDTLSVRAINSCGQYGEPRILPIRVDSPPVMPQAILGNDSVCLGSQQTYTIQSPTSIRGYAWQLPAGWIGASDSASISTIVGNQGGTLQVQLSNACGISAGQSLPLFVAEPPLQPAQITGNPFVGIGDSSQFSTSIMAGALRYHWSLNGGGRILTGQNSNKVTIQWEQAGIYTLSVQSENQCGISEKRLLSILFEGGTDSNPYVISVSPNPSNGPFLLRAYGLQGKSIQLELLNMAGQRIHRTGKMPGTAVYSHTLRLDSYAQGIYLLRIQVDNRVFLRKLEKIN